jgi:ATP-dependent DNA helicase RecG
VLAFIKKYGTADRKDIDELLMDKLPDVLSLKQKSNKINRLLSHKMSKELNLITNIGSRRSSSWILVQGKGSG